MKRMLGSFALGWCLAACGAPGRPSGLPPPEYEKPQVDPWTPASAPAEIVESPPPEAPPAGVTPAPEGPAGLPQNAGGSGATLPPGNP